MSDNWMTAEEVIAQWFRNHHYISTPEWAAQNLLSDLKFYDYTIARKVGDDEE